MDFRDTGVNRFYMCTSFSVFFLRSDCTNNTCSDNRIIDPIAYFESNMAY